MICPIMSNRINYVDDNFIKCVREECSWYNERKGECCMKTLAKQTSYIGEMAKGDRTLFVREC